MKTTELRIGNYVRDDLSIIKVTSILKEKNDRTIHGIVLTEDRLLNFGFEKDDVKGFYTIDGWFKVSLYGDVELQSGDMYEYHSVLAQSSYVHQLQNLYFALTQKELSLKDENTL